MGEYAFVGTIALVFLLGAMSPGPSFIIVAKTAISRSKEKGFAVAIGMGFGAVFFSLLAIYGLYVVLENIPPLYMGLKILGGLYLCYLAFMMWKHSHEPLNTTITLEEDGKTFLGYVLFGFLSQLSNPKTAIVIGSIFAALLPSTIPPLAPLLLALVAFFIDVLWYSTVVMVFSTKKAQKVYLNFKKTIDRIAGSVLGGLGVKLILDH